MCYIIPSLEFETYSFLTSLDFKISIFLWFKQEPPISLTAEESPSLPQNAYTLTI